MSRLIPPFAAIRAFDAVAHFGGIRKAAVELNRDHAAVSRQLRALEEWLGSPLFERRTGALTPEGLLYQKRIARALDEIDAATRQVAKRESDGVILKVWCAPGFASRWLSARLAQFQDRHPEVEIELRPADRRPDLLQNEADADVRYVVDGAAGPPQGVRMIDIVRPQVMPVASPDYLACKPPVQVPEDLLSQRLLHEEDYSEWTTWLTAQGCEVGDRLSGPRLWHAHLTLDAAIRGEGIALANSFLVREDLEEGRLVRVLPASTPVAFGAYYFTAREGRWRHRSVLRFREWLVETAQAAPEFR